MPDRIPFSLAMLDDPLQTPIQFLPGCGPRRAELLAKLDILTLRDLLFTMPRDVLDLTHISPVEDLTSEAVFTVRGRVVDRDARLLSNGRTVVAILLECRGEFVRGVWFSQPWMLQKFRENDILLFSGKPKKFQKRWEFSHPRVTPVEADDAETTGGVLPKYGLTEGLSMREMRRLTQTAVEHYAEAVPDTLPQSFRDEFSLVSMSAALRGLHAPQTLAEYEQGRRRLIVEDLLEFQLGLAMRQRLWRTRGQSLRLPVSTKIDARIRRLFPFTLTQGQDRAIQDVCRDLDSGGTMHRLLQADVGAGKTVVAIYAMLLAVAAGAQTALMVPTEVLARQHWNTLDRLLAESRVTRLLLTGELTAAERVAALTRIRNGEVQLVVGTQALIQSDVVFKQLGLVVIDEQHKFGVAQRAHFAGLAQQPHTLIMTATPIPRSLCLTQFGDLDLSVITEMPQGRQPIVTTWVRGAAAEQKMWQFIRKKIQSGRQMFVVCPRIESTASDVADLDESRLPFEQLSPVRPPVVSSTAPNSPPGNVTVSPPGTLSPGTPPPARSSPSGASHDPQAPPGVVPAVRLSIETHDGPGAVSPGMPSRIDAGSVSDVYERLRTHECREFVVGLLHGQMSAAEKSEMMDRFRRGEVQVLVATTVIEVGVDVSNATLMLIHDAETFGLSQLHQLRGRVGRGSFQGYCFLLSRTQSPEATARLQAFEKLASGFEVAEADFELRGPGDLLGTKQHGELPLRCADLRRDQKELSEAREAAFVLVRTGQFDGLEFGPLKRAVLERFGTLFELAGSG